jgi:acid phosphatase family membrane protein YuiD
MLIQSLELDPEKYPRLKERVGHRVPEVIVGLVYGIILSIGLMWIIGKIY